jgi:hypothetical protein
MKRSLALTVLVCAFATPVRAQSPFGSISIPCGGVFQWNNLSSQFGTGYWIQYTVTSVVPPNACVSQVYVDANVVGVFNSALHRQATWTASAQRQVPVNFAGPWITNGSHAYRITFSLFPVEPIQSQSTALVVDLAPPPPDPIKACSDQGVDYYWNGFECVYSPGSPILIDVGGKGYKLTSVEDGVLFDIDGDGTREQVSWTARGAENAFLAIDRNGNGRIDDGTELFGTATPVLNGASTAANGFEALRFYQVGGFADVDDVVSAADGVFGQLLLWTDRNQNGVSEPDELQTLTSAGIGAIGLHYRAIGRRDRYGNTFRQAAKLTWSNGQQSNIYDVWFQRAR